MLECHLCMLEYSSDAGLRPVVLSCGHTICYTCFLKIKDCPVCKLANTSNLKNGQELKGSFNFILECKKGDANLNALNAKNKESINGHHYCFDCCKPFRNVGITFLQEEHYSHKTINLADRKFDQVKSFLWVQQNPKININGSSMLDSFLRLWFCMFDTILESLDCLEPRGDWIEDSRLAAFQMDCKTLIEEGEHSLNLSANSKPKALLKLRNLEAALHKPLALATQQFGQPILQQLITPQYLEGIRFSQLSNEMSVAQVLIPQLEPSGIKGLADKALRLAVSNQADIAVPASAINPPTMKNQIIASSEETELENPPTAKAPNKISEGPRLGKRRSLGSN